ncbi:MAG: Non-phosphorylating glyceraldehyde-3-phosphate dehydrogenase [Gammaproteobacteria bacterium]|jgi:acyl-CoA reductase-like NAD-dependent aldehyde dehydrogenase|nr:Non-phosphorylating glyceraldehyde-3-phosphate dehydrogenase [Gammaproteobacteria bacterium]
MPNLKVLSPFDHRVIAEVELWNEARAEKALAAAYDLFNQPKKALAVPERIAILEKAHQLLVARREEFAKRAAEEGGKPLVDSLVETERAAQGIKIAIESMSHMTGNEIAMGITPSSLHRMAYTFREPVGVVLAISAFNHPLNLVVHQVIPAIAVGCPVLIKPASSTPLSCLAFLELLYEAGLPRAYAQAVICPSAIAEKLVSDPRISFLSFIGSSRVGWHLRSLLPPGAGCTLEHGGAAPVIMEADADMADAVPLLTKGGFYHAGQVCISVQRIFASEKIAQQLAQQITAAAEKLRVGDPLDAKTEVGPLITATELKRVATWVDEAVAAGAKLLCGGKALSDSCYAPTILYNAPLSTKVCTEEVFGPVVCINSYAQRDEAIKNANALPFSFQAAVFTQSIDVALEMVKRLQANTVLVNDHTAFRVDWMPFSGRKQSGFGIGGIPYSMQDMTYEKMMVIRSSSL